MTQQQHAEPGASKVERSLSLLEKAVQFRFALLVLSLVLAADIGLNWYREVPLSAFRWGQGDAGVPLGAVLLFGGAFVFFMSAVAPALLAVLKGIGDRVGLTHEIGCDAEGQYHRGYVLLRDAKKRALLEKDSFWIKRIDDEEARHQREQDERLLTARISFACTVLLLVDGWGAGPASLVHMGVALFIWLEASLPLAVVLVLAVIAVVLIAAPWFSWLRRDSYPSRWIHHPQLAQERHRELQEQKGGPAYRRHVSDLQALSRGEG